MGCKGTREIGVLGEVFQKVGVDGRYIVMEVGELEENVRYKFAKCSGDVTFFLNILLLSMSVLCLTIFLPLCLQYLRSLHLFETGVSAWVRARSCCTSLTH